MEFDLKPIISVEFDYEDSGCWYFHNFIKALSNMNDEINIRFKDNKMIMRFFDPSRIMLAELVKEVDYDGEELVYGLNINDLKHITKVRKGKNAKNVRLNFFDSKNTFKISVEKYNESTTITKTLSQIEIDEGEDIPMDNLRMIEYPTEFVLLNEQLEDLFYESGIYSEVLEIIVNNRVEFRETGQIGEGVYPFKKAQLPLFEKQSNVEKVSSAHSLTFLKALKPFLNLLSDDAWIRFAVKTSHPLHLHIDFDEVGFKMDYFLAPRVDEDELYDDEDWEEEF